MSSRPGSQYQGRGGERDGGGQGEEGDRAGGDQIQHTQGPRYYINEA